MSLPKSMQAALIFGAGWFLGGTANEYMHPRCPSPKVVYSETPLCYNNGITTAAIKLTYGECKEICKVRERMNGTEKKADR